MNNIKKDNSREDLLNRFNNHIANKKDPVKVFLDQINKIEYKKDRDTFIKYSIKDDPFCFSFLLKNISEGSLHISEEDLLDFSKDLLFSLGKDKSDTFSKDKVNEISMLPFFSQSIIETFSSDDFNHSTLIEAENIVSENVDFLESFNEMLPDELAIDKITTATNATKQNKVLDYIFADSSNEYPTSPDFEESILLK